MKNSVFPEKLKASCLSVLPIVIIVVVLNFAISPMKGYAFGEFLLGAFSLIFGSSLYSVGVDAAIEPIGEHVGNKISRSKNIFIMLAASFAIGCVVTAAEPSLFVLANQVSLPDETIILAVSVGVGLFMAIAVLRVALKIDLNILFAAAYAATFIMVIFADKSVIPLAFDSGGVTTGLITVPFIMTLAAGIGSVLGGTKAQENSFGLIGVCSIGPIIIILFLSLIVKTDNSASVPAVAEINSVGDIFRAYLTELSIYLKRVAIAVAPIAAVFLLMRIFFLKLPAKRLARISIGLLFTYAGISIFLTGVNVGFMGTGVYIGGKVASVNRYLVIPIGAAMGAVIALAEPAVRVLNKQVEEITGGTISRKTMALSLMLSMATAVGLSMVRVATGVNILYILVPGYAIAVILSFFVPKIFTGIAFDSGGVASGPMTASFLLPFATGACGELGGDILADAFGTIGFVALAPLAVLQILGLAYKLKVKKAATALVRRNAELLAREGEIIEFDAGGKE